MPKTNLHSADNSLTTLLYGTMRSQRIKMYELAEKMGVSLCTLRRWLARPEQMELRQAQRICKLLGIPKETMCAEWKW